MRDDFQHELRWYERRMHRRGTYRHFAAAIHDVFEPRSLVDVGCGLGWIVEWMLEHGVPAFGDEGCGRELRGAICDAPCPRPYVSSTSTSACP